MAIIDHVEAILARAQEQGHVLLSDTMHRDPSGDIWEHPTRASMAAWIEPRLKPSHYLLDQYLRLVEIATRRGQFVVLRPNGLVQVLDQHRDGTVSNPELVEAEWVGEALERLTARPPQPITLEVVRQQAADLGARVVERADDRIEIYLPSTERRIHEERHDFRSLETAGAFLSGIAVRKAQFG